ALAPGDGADDRQRTGVVGLRLGDAFGAGRSRRLPILTSSTERVGEDPDPLGDLVDLRDAELVEAVDGGVLLEHTAAREEVVRERRRTAVQRPRRPPTRRGSWSRSSWGR